MLLTTKKEFCINSIFSVLLCLFILLTFIVQTFCLNGDQWAIYIQGGDSKANQIANRHNLINLGEVIPDSNIYHFSVKSEHRGKRSTNELSNIEKLLEIDPQTKWIKEQRILKRSKRVPLTPHVPRSIFLHLGYLLNLISKKEKEPLYQLQQNQTNFVSAWNDPYWPQMWFLNRGDDDNGNKLDMNVEEAWRQGVSGKGVVVTIVDDGIEWTHPDLKDNYDPVASTDLNDHDADPFPRYDPGNSNGHGTRCAGVVAARGNNSLCGVGIAYESKIGGIRILDGPLVDALEAKSLSFNRNYTDIYSSSWGPDDDGKTVDGPGPLTKQALKEGAHKGRNGLGSIFVWASGNGGRKLDHCNTDGFVTSIYTLSINSASENGRIPWYSEPCSSTIATTYSSGSLGQGERKVITTTLHGKCTASFTGTSASTPIAASVIALAIEANPNLSWRDVQHLVVRNSRPRGNLKATDWAVNGVGLHFSHSYGFGLMDAGALVKMAKNWNSIPQQHTCHYVDTNSHQALENVISPGNEKPFIINAEQKNCIAKVNYIEHVHIKVNLSSTAKRGQLSVSLVSPLGTRSELLGVRPNDITHKGFGQFREWPMMSVHFWGETPIGTWTLIIKNHGRQYDPITKTATLHDWQLIIYGTETDPQPNMKINAFP